MATASGYYTNVKSYDITSSYPSVMCRKKFPIGAFKKCVGSFWYYIDSDEYSCVGKFRLKNVQAKTNLCYLSEHKILKYVGDDGPLSYALSVKWSQIMGTMSLPREGVET